MDDSANRHGAAHDDDALPRELAAAYKADAERDAMDVAAGWNLLRPLLSRGVLRSRRRVFASGMAAGILLAASIALLLRTKPELPAGAGSADVSGAVVTTASTASAQYLRTVADLETALRSGRARLQPQTLDAIEQSLMTIDRAIRDAEAALSADPANDYVAQWLETVRDRKLRALRQAVTDINTVS